MNGWPGLMAGELTREKTEYFILGFSAGVLLTLLVILGAKWLAIN